MRNMYVLRLRSILLFNLGLILLLLILGIFIIDYADSHSDNEQPYLEPPHDIHITVDCFNRTLELYSGHTLYKRYRIAVGKAATPTPIGEWIITYKSYSPKEIYGTRWMGLNIPWGSYGIHGTNMPWSIGYFASHGCIRMRNKDVEELYEWVPLGTPVKINGPQTKIQRILQRDQMGPDVIVLQLRLIELGYFQDRADGCFGRDTEAAVRAFERDKGLTETGVVNKQLLKLLGL